MDESSPLLRGDPQSTCQGDSVVPTHAQFNPDMISNAAAYQANKIQTLCEKTTIMHAQLAQIDDLAFNTTLQVTGLETRFEELKDELQRVKQHMELQQKRDNEEHRDLNELRVLEYFLLTVVKLAHSDIDILKANGIDSFHHLRCLSTEKLKTLNMDISRLGMLSEQIDRLSNATIIKCAQELQLQQLPQQPAAQPNSLNNQQQQPALVPIDYGGILRPNYDCVSFSSIGNTPMSMYALRLFRMTRAGRKISTEYNVKFACADTISRRIKQSDIRSFLDTNGVDNVNPSINVGRQKHVTQEAQPVATPGVHATRKQTSHQQGAIEFVKLQALLQVAECKEPHNAELAGEQTVYALRDIPQWTVLGEYCGVDMLEKEYEDVWQNNVEKSENEKYALKKHVTIRVPFGLLLEIYRDGDVTDSPRIDGVGVVDDNHNHNHNRVQSQSQRSQSPVFSSPKRNIFDVYENTLETPVTPTTKRRKLNAKNDEHVQSLCHDKEFVILTDALRLKQVQKIDYPLWEINDCRKYIFMHAPSTQDESRRNVRLVSCLVDEWPRYFIINDKEIKRGDQLLAYYGPLYEDNIYAQRRDRKLKTKLQAQHV